MEDIQIPEIAGMFTTFHVGEAKTPLFVDPQDFVDTHHYARFMGFDKPVDFKLDLVEKEELNSKATEDTNETKTKK